jgi:putative GTP pyrophosphokinase
MTRPIGKEAIIAVNLKKRAFRHKKRRTAPRSEIPDTSMVEEIRREHETLGQNAEELLAGLRSEVTRRLQAAGLSATIKARVKSFQSYYFKRLRSVNQRKAGDPAEPISDLLGLRIVCPFLEDLSRVETVLQESFEVIEVKRKGLDHSFNQFGYSATHLLVAVPGRILASCGRKTSAVCEIQMSTILQDAWAEVEHELVYKAEFTPFDEPLKRKLAALNANLTLSDLIFQEIRDYQHRLQAELRERRDSVARKIQEICCAMLAEVLPATERSSGRQKEQTQALPVLPAGGDTMDDLLVTALSKHNDGQYAAAISLYTSILDMTTQELVQAIVRVHRGMAYFSQGDYQAALEDFAESIRLNPANPKALYHRGVTFQVLEDYHAARDDLDRAVTLNPFQFDALFQRAQTCYHLGDYARAFDDCEKALLIDPDSVQARRFCDLLRSRLGV